jgi:hypothetical protein
VVLAAVAALALAHALAIAPHYVVGSFDDDGHYLALARALAHGKGFVDTSMPGSPVEGLYPPGYPALLVPLVWLGGAMWLLRGLSLVLFLACIPLLDRLLRDHDMPEPVRVAALVLFALNPVAATFGTEVMPESAFLVVLLLVLIALPRWERQRRTLSAAGLVVMLGAPMLVALKIAGVPMLLAVGGWLLLRRQWRKLVATVAGAAVLLAPVLAVRLLGGSIAGARYSSDYAQTGPISRAIPRGLGGYLQHAIPDSLVPVGPFDFAGHGPLATAFGAFLRYSALPIALVGWWAWLRRRLDVTVLLIPLYLVETVPFPFVNERRAILILPLVVGWYALGWWQVVGVLRRGTQQRTVALALPAVLALPVLGAQFSRDYLLRNGQTTPAARGSGYVSALHEVTPRGWSIATSYQWTIALWTGRTATNFAHFTYHCPPGGAGNVALLHRELRQRHVATVLSFTSKWPGELDNVCVRDALARAPWAVPVYTGSDVSTVFVLLGPGTPRAGEVVAVHAGAPATAVTALPRSETVREVSVELTTRAPHALLQLHTAGGWVTVAHDVAGLLHATFSTPLAADSVRVVGAAPGSQRELTVLADGGSS